MKCYLVDYENVNSAGLTGINKLSSDDLVMIFYSDNASTVTFAAMDMIRKSSADIRRYKLKHSSANAADFQVCTYLGYLMGNAAATDIFIISKDRGYMSCLEFCRSCLSSAGKNVDIFSNISDALNSIGNNSSIGITYPVASAVSNDSLKIEVSESKKEAAASAPVIEEKTAKHEPVSDVKHIEINTAERLNEIHILTDDISEKIAPKKHLQPSEKAEKNAEKKTPSKTADVDAVAAKVAGIFSSDDKIKSNGEMPAVCRNVANFIVTSNDKHDLYIRMVKEYGQKSGVNYYNAIKKEYSNLKLRVN